MESHLDMQIRKIALEDNPKIALLIRDVMPEFGANGPGFAICDPEVDQMFQTYQTPGAKYFVIADDMGTIWGCGGYGPLKGGLQNVCEVRKMYFKSELRGRGYGAQLLQRILDEAMNDQYDLCYLETMSNMRQAQKLYEKFSFQRLAEPLGSTGHFGCDVWYSRKI
jgi:putative acetyltransferase